MKAFSLAWLLGRPVRGRLGPQLLTASAYALTAALLMLVAAGGWSFTAVQDELSGLYLVLAGLAVALLVVPLAVLGAAAARLSARSHDQRLATVRLLGGTPALAAAVTVIESAAVALAGVLSGVVLYLLGAPLVGLLHFRGQAIGAAMFMPVGAIALLALAVVAVGVVSAVVGLRRLNVSPLGVRTRAAAPGARWIRALIAGVVIVTAFTALQFLSAFRDFALMIAVLIGAFAAVLAVLNIVGPWAVRLLAGHSLTRAQTPERLLAARMILESPAAAWRQVSAVAMTSFVAVLGGSGAALMKASVTEESAAGDRALAQDILTGVVVTVLVSFIGVCCSAVINQCAQTLDRRELYVNLGRLGMDAATMDRARVRAVMGPLLWVCLGSALIAGILLLPLVGVALVLSPLTILVVVGTLAAGVVAVRASVALAGARLVLHSS
ncbi:MAG: permease [Micrococcaceae bacterium]|uniref:permease n=1 Tax=Arthrobacter sp. 179 TaxID=3457734 RepID=UPI00264F82B7|nr:permease [Micrococcaceae bacterium]MDN5824722.1 permease [Micrococcaceae bacterium]MDN5878610.1 permease [Micrococcaceae bacterium]MDN5886171.1 permease [Micrococcaceae bacterium]MDN6170185.1 permease [Micrococcaceae bacterium]